MSQTIDTLAFARMLRNGGFEEAQAETLASAIQECVVKELVTTTDLERAVTDLRRDISDIRAEVRRDISDLRRDVAREGVDLRRELTIRLGGLLMAGVAALAVLIKLG